ncbi:MAG: acyltransferase [Planctomycetes bacterium]|nr:acyltransferase [Planctomycetota bacterium]
MPSSPSPLLDHAEFRATRTFAALDGIRALSVLAVVLYHFEPLPWAPLRTLQHAGFFGVDVFFVLSGFLITTLLLREPPRPVGTALWHFYARRTLRIFPLFYVACALYAGAAWLRGGEPWLHYRDYLLPLLFYWSDVRLALQPEPFPWFGHAWSLAVEEKFYLLWPFVALAWRRAHGRAFALATIAAVTVWRAWLALGQDDSHALRARLWYAFDLRIDTLMWGCVLAYALHDERRYERLVGWLRRPWLPVLALALAIALAVDTVLHANTGLRLCVRYTLAPPLLALALAAAVVAPGTAALRWLQWRPLAWVGAISYGVYVLHPLAGFAVNAAARRLFADTEATLPLLLRLVAYVALAMAISGASFRWFEAPLLRLKARFR